MPSGARCAPARLTHWPGGPLTSPNRWSGAGRGDSRRFSRGRGGFSGSAYTLRSLDPSGASPGPGRARSREVSSGPRRGHQASGRAVRILGKR